jgi:hypothetical protein
MKKDKIDRLYELDQLIMKVWGFSDDLELIIKKMRVSSEREDIVAVSKLFELRMESLWKGYESCFENPDTIKFKGHQVNDFFPSKDGGDDTVL